jgi:hypothetical protein
VSTNWEHCLLQLLAVLLGVKALQAVQATLAKHSSATTDLPAASGAADGAGAGAVRSPHPMH